MEEYTETVCTPEGCYTETDMLAWMADSPLGFIIAGLVFAVGLWLVRKRIGRFFKAWRRHPLRMTAFVAVGVAVSVMAWPHLGALPLLGMLFAVLFLLGLVLRVLGIGAPPSKEFCPECAQYGEEECEIHGVG